MSTTGSIGSAEGAAAPIGYKPSLTVNVDIKDAVASTGTTPRASQTPHVSTNIFVAGVPSFWDDDALREHYKEFGEILSTKIVKNRHFGFVMFRNPEAAHAAINGTHLTRPVQSSPTVLHVSIAMHDEGVDHVPSNRIFVRGLPQWSTKEHLIQCFTPFGTIVECAVLMNPLGQCKGSGFVLFGSVSQATAAVEASDRVRIDGWDQPLEIKYSETAEVRQQRQERNRNRQRNWVNTPKYKGPNTSSNPLPSPFPLYQQTMPVLPSPHGFPVMGALPFPLVYPSPHHPTVPPPPPQMQSANLGSPSPVSHVIYPQPLVQQMQNNFPFYQPQSMVVVKPPPLPQKGDLHFSGGPLTEELVRTLLSPFGAVEHVMVLDAKGGIAARMSDVTRHPFIAQQLNGTLFSTGQVLAAGLCA